MKIEFKNCIEQNDFYDNENTYCLICIKAVREFFNLGGPIDLTISLHPFKGSKRFLVKSVFCGDYRWTHKTKPGWWYLSIQFGKAVELLKPKDITNPTTIYVRCTAAAKQA